MSAFNKKKIAAMDSLVSEVLFLESISMNIEDWYYCQFVRSNNAPAFIGHPAAPPAPNDVSLSQACMMLREKPLVRLIRNLGVSYAG